MSLDNGATPNPGEVGVYVGASHPTVTPHVARKRHWARYSDALDRQMGSGGHQDPAATADHIPDAKQAALSFGRLFKTIV